MSSSIVWVITPIFLGGILLLLRRFEKAVAAAGTGISMLLTGLAWFLPIGQALPFLPSITIQETFVVLGRQFILIDADRPYLVLTYLVVSMWLAGAWIGRGGRFLVPIGLIISGLLVAALAVEPPLYAAMLIELSALLSIPVLAPPGKPASRGVLRFITFQTLGMPFILASGWFLPAVVADPFSKPVLTSLLLMLMGFALVAAIFPFHTWLISLTEEANPYSAAFIFFILLSNIGLFGITFINRLDWLRNYTLIFDIFGLMGCVTVFTAGLWAAFQRDLGRILGYGMLIIVGTSLLALSQGLSISTTEGTSTSTTLLTADLFLAFFIPNGLALAVWSLGLSIVRSQTESPTFQDIQGLAFRLPFASAGLLTANLSLASLPLLAGYPLYLTLFSKLGATSMIIALFTILGIGGLMISALRTMAALFSNTADQPAWSISETRIQIAYLLGGILLLLIFGLLPQLIQPLSNISIP